tara:strand:+ start:1468 stop:1917 length:450 start_codon:yes stop_codon:yes gene_type:complete
MKKYLYALFLFSVCFGKGLSDNVDKLKNPVLNSLRERTDSIFDKKSRIFKTIVTDSSDFNYIYPNTDITCGFVIRHFFYTNIFLGANSNELISMDGTTFSMENSNYPTINENYIVSLTSNVINTIGGMSYGSIELRDFLETFQIVDISH